MNNVQAKNKGLGRLPALLAAVGLLVSIGLEALHVQTYLNPAWSGFCAVGERLDCTTVALSRYSVFLGVPVAIWGIIGFATIVWSARKRQELLLPLAALAAVASTVLLIIEIVAIGSICMFCESVHLISLGLLLVVWRRRDRIDMSTGYLRSYGRIARDLALPAACLLVIGLFFPKYWLLATWKSGMTLNNGVDEDGRPWIGAEQPELVIHEYVDYACPHCAIASGHMRVRVGRSPNKIRLVRHHYPRMHCMTKGSDELGMFRCTYARAAICAGEQGRFWEMEDWLFRNVTWDAKQWQLEKAAKAVDVDLEKLDACMKSRETYERAERDVEEALSHKIRNTPGYLVDGEKLDHSQLVERIGYY